MSLLSRSLALMFTCGVVAGAAAQDTLPIQIDIDNAAFAYDAGQSMLELYLAFEANTLTYRADSSGYRAELPVDLAILKSTLPGLPASDEDQVWADSVTLSFLIPDTTGLASGQHFVHQVRTVIPPGEYQMQVTIPADTALDRPQVMLRRDVLVPDFSDPSLVGLSDLTLATAIQRSRDRGSKFYKNGLLIRPNANQLYGSGLSRLFYYAEAYHLDHLDAEEYTVFAYIAEANLPQPLPGLQRRTTRPTRSPDVLVGQFDLSALPSGSYYLRVALLNDANEALAEQSRKFFVYNPGVQRAAPVAAEASFETSPYATMPAEEVDKAFRHIDVIATDQERSRMKKIQDLDERRRFLMDFWLKRDPNTTTPANEYKEQIYQRIQYANDRYTTGRREGWDTDRGHTLIKYGTPTAVEPHLFDRGFAPYEIWKYNNIPGEGQAIFIFADLDGFGLFELIHSTVTGERKLANWQEEIRKN